MYIEAASPSFTTRTSFSFEMFHGLVSSSSCEVSKLSCRHSGSYSTVNHSDLTPFIPILITLITPLQPSPDAEWDEDEFVLVSDVLQDILSRSALSDGAGTKVLTEPLLVWCERYGRIIVDQLIVCKFMIGLVESLWLTGQRPS